MASKPDDAGPPASSPVEVAGATPEKPSFAAQKTPTLPEVIDNLGFGLAQVRAGCIGSGVMFADGAELLLISSVTEAVADQWGLGPSQRGMVVTIVFLGIMVGNFASGPIGDNWGRRQLIICSFAGIFVFSILSSLTMGFTTLAIARFFVGVSFGIGQPAWGTLGAEVTPSKWRVAMQAFSQSFFIFGEVYSTVLLIIDDPTMQHLHWRWLLQMGAIPSAVFGVLAVVLLHQSPSYYAMTNQYDRAKDVLESMRHDNRAYDVPIDFKLAQKRSDLPPKLQRLSRRLTITSKRDLMRQVRVVFGPQLRVTTLIVMYSCFVLNLMYYGCLYAFPQVLASSSGMKEGAAIQLLVGALWEIPGEVLGIGMGMLMNRLPNIKVYLLLTGFSVLCFTLAMQVHTKASIAFQTMGYYGIKCFVDIGFVVVYQYAIEVYPTEARTTGTAITMGCGRIAGIIAPLVFEGLYSQTGSFFTFFWILLGAVVLNFLLVQFLSIETQGKPLLDELEDEQVPEKGTNKADAYLADEDSEAAALIEDNLSPLIQAPLIPR
jgi:MFS family permease